MLTLKKEERSQVNNLTSQLKELEREKQTKAKISRREEIIKIRAEVDEIENRKTETKSTSLRVGLFKRSTKLTNTFNLAK